MSEASADHRGALRRLVRWGMLLLATAVAGIWLLHALAIAPLGGLSSSAVEVFGSEYAYCVNGKGWRTAQLLLLLPGAAGLIGAWRSTTSGRYVGGFFSTYVLWLGLVAVIGDCDFGTDD